MIGCFVYIAPLARPRNDTKRFGERGSASPVLARECSLRLLMLLSHSGRFGDLEIRRTDSKNSPKLPIS